MKDYYIVLTGAYDNSGDFLIRDRALSLLRAYRPDRDIVEWSRRESFDQQKIAIANKSKAIILAGGPSVQSKVYPEIFPLTDLNRLEPPLILFGAGWKGGGGSWRHENSYSFRDASHALIKRLSSDGVQHSLRDYHTFRILARRGVQAGVVTGCPAIYGAFTDRAEEIRAQPPKSVKRVAISAGVKFVHEPRLEQQLIELIRRLRSEFHDAVLKVVFHHSVDQHSELPVLTKSRRKFIAAHRRLNARIDTETDAERVNVGGGLAPMLNEYRASDMHIGYRVHAHAFMSSIGKPSYLIAEDGRGTGMGQVTGAFRTVVGAELPVRSRNPIERLRRKLSTKGMLHVNRNAVEDIVSIVRLDYRNDWVLSYQSSKLIAQNFSVMHSFLMKLP